jgi:hypothetical protein
MSIERIVLATAGALTLLSLLLALTVSLYWLWLAAFVGLNLLQSAFSRFCPLAIVLRRFGLTSGPCSWTR